MCPPHGHPRPGALLAAVDARSLKDAAGRRRATASAEALAAALDAERPMATA
ncbi:MAG: hypothetical protein HY690_00280 [Chloroflexi bacterium]|nr:hypothetical protein [Chloroflexota bacterium]